MDLDWLDPHQLDPRDAAGALAVLEVARAADTPVLAPMLTTSFTHRLEHGWDGDPPLTAVHRDARGRIDAVLDVWLPRWDNRHIGLIGVTVDPLSRGTGLGRALYEAGVERARADNRTTILSETYDYPAGVGFLTAMGLSPAAENIMRRQDPAELDWTRLDGLYEAAERKATAYDLVRVAGLTPADQLDAVAVMTAAINDSPMDGLDVEDDVYTPERVHRFETAQLARGRRIYRLMARHRDTGELAGHTMVGVDRERPWLGFQFDTSVVRAHRGNRLGLLLKIGMLRWLAVEEPQLRSVDTGNAASNSYMISINDAIGYKVIGSVLEYQVKQS
ncbi:GNAT family N-acetyltransferase [Virgisporangium aurantiacum]|uniref:GNAT family N-acetyltransferase n=1 Tax=Virgisporangium aurantiacum TaxID=175570 RepID=A0A8J3YZI3_9ACTN|nr:GNAT family N-acetyltransferase [Virgisporangium aurantiacum]GIJ52590.1 GNAT family N-acetyltransferase [Virgisporangium aurantiacum]